MRIESKIYLDPQSLHHY